MAGTPKNELDKIQKEMDCDNMSGEVDGAAQTCYKRVKRIIYGIHNIFSIFNADWYEN